MRQRISSVWKWISEKMRQKPVRRLFYIVVVIVSLGFIAYAAYSNWSELQAQQWELNYWYLLLSVLLFPVGFLPTVTAWHELLSGLGSKLPYITNLRIYALSSLPRHIPGLVWYVSSRSLLYQDVGLSAALVVASSAAEIFLLAVTGFMMSILILLNSAAPIEQFPSLRFIIPAALLLIIILISASPPVFKRFSAWLVRRWNYRMLPEISRQSLVKCVIWLMLAWCGGGLLLFLLVNGLVPLDWSNYPVMIGIWGLSSAIGLTIGIGISGMGLREVTMGALLSLVIPPITAIVAAIAFRLALTLGEFLWVFLIAWITKSVPKMKGTDG